MKRQLYNIVAVIAVSIGYLSLAYAESKHATVIIGNQPGTTPTDIHTLAQELQGTGVNWVLIAVLWTWAEPQPSTANPQGAYSYYGPTTQGWHNYQTLDILDQFTRNTRDLWMRV